MLHKLRINHFVLVDSCELAFNSGFHVITGETGSGKSVLLSAIALLLGERADGNLVRQGEKMAVIEGDFYLHDQSKQVLEDLEIEVTGPSCTLRREILCSGKSKAFVDGQLISLNTLKSLSSSFVEVSGQHACLLLKERNTPESLLDRYASLEKKVSLFSKQYSLFLEKQKILQKLLSEESSRETECDQIRKHLKEIEISQIEILDDKDLFNRLRSLENAKELFDLASAITSDLEGGKQPLLSSLFRLSNRAEQLASLDHEWEPVSELLRASCSSAKEATNELNRRISSLQFSEEERSSIEQQLHCIDVVQRKYGPTLNDVLNTKSTYQAKLKDLEERDQKLELLRTSIQELQAHCDHMASDLSQKRAEAACRFQTEIQQQLKSLNMHQVVFEVDISPSSRTSTGDDNVRLFFTPNVGEKRLDVSESASGGELARIYLAIQAVMADRHTSSTILFDEIDASIGGLTATAVGETLAAIGEHRQVLAVTHFPQVASKATIQYSIFKKVRQGRTVTHILPLTTEEKRQREYQRMSGEKSL